MLYLVISAPMPNDRRDVLRAAEEEALAHLVAEGFIAQIYRRDDGAGAYSIIEAPSAEEARRRLSALPFVREQAISIEIVPVTARYPGQGPDSGLR